MMLMRSHYARDFAQTLGTEMTNQPLLGALRDAQSQGEHKALVPYITESLNAFLEKKGVIHSPEDILLDWEGNVERPLGTQAYGYPLLGARTYPDAAVLRPFTCAFEFDREGGPAKFKERFMKAAVHVLSGAYDACLLVYMLKSGSTAQYTEDGETHSSRLLANLEAHGLFVTFIPAAERIPG